MERRIVDHNEFVMMGGEGGASAIGGCGGVTVTGLSGILRKGSYGYGSSSDRHLRGYGGSEDHRASSSNADLLVFGYACKLYRDDARALEIDQGKHLIPWMDDSNLKIDRYDVRGTLYELAPYEAPIGGYGNRLDYLTPEEQRAEQLCEDERYLFLRHNEETYIERQEEEFKRSHQQANGGDYCQVNFVYDQPSLSNATADGTANDLCGDPANSSNENKDSSDFQPFELPLNFDIPKDIQLPETMKQHTIIEKTARFIAKQGIQMEILLKAKQSNNVQFDFLSLNSPLNPYYKFIVTALKNGTYPEKISTSKCEEKKSSCSDSGTRAEHLENKEISDLEPIVIPIIKYKPSADCAYTQLISKIKGVPLTELERLQSDKEAREAMVENNSTNSSDKLQPNTFPCDTEVKIISNSCALALTQNYGSETESEGEAEEAQKATKEEEEQKRAEMSLIEAKFPIPEENLRNIIDKTALYVIKNGRKFEQTLLTKSVERFTFLLADNEYYPYYLYKVTDDLDAASKEQKQRRAVEVAAAVLTKKGIGKDQTSSVSFHLKSKEEIHSAKTVKDVMPQDQNVEARDEQGKVVLSNGHHLNELEAAVAMAAAVAVAIPPPPPPSMKATAASRPPHQLKQHHHPNDPYLHNVPPPSSHPNGTHATLREKIVSKFESNKDAKCAEEKNKDKLAQIAREKLGGLVSKDKQLQSERKRRAMEFLNQIRNNAKTDTAGECVATKSAAKSENCACEVVEQGKGEAAVANQNLKSTNDLESSGRKCEAITALDESASDKERLMDKSIPIKFFGPEDQINPDDDGDDAEDDEEMAEEQVATEKFKKQFVGFPAKTYSKEKKMRTDNVMEKCSSAPRNAISITISDDNDDNRGCKLRSKRDNEKMFEVDEEEDDDAKSGMNSYRKYMLCSLSENSVSESEKKSDRKDSKATKVKKASSRHHHKKKKSKSTKSRKSNSKSRVYMKSRSRSRSRSRTRTRSRFRSRSRVRSSSHSRSRSGRKTVYSKKSTKTDRSRSPSMHSSRRKRARRDSSLTPEHTVIESKSRKHKDSSSKKHKSKDYDDVSKYEHRSTKRSPKRDDSHHRRSSKSSSSKHKKHKRSSH